MINKIIDAMRPKYKGATGIGDVSNYYVAEEVIASGEIKTFENKEPVGYTFRNQNGSNTCVAQSSAKLCEIANKLSTGETVIYSATPIYQSRSNKPNAGMSFGEAIDFTIKNGLWLESEVQSQNAHDSFIENFDYSKYNSVYNRPLNKFIVNCTFDNVADNIAKFGAVMLYVACSVNEWNRDVPAGLSDSKQVSHGVTGVDSITFNGIRYIIIEDSWGKWDNKSGLPLKAGQRAITEEFFNKHISFAIAIGEWKFKTSKPTKYTFTKVLNYREESDEVVELQNRLKSLGYFPSNQKSTGYYGKITADAVYKWQIANKVAGLQELNELKGKTFGKKSIKSINK